MSSTNIIFAKRIQEVFGFLVDGYGYRLTEQQVHQSIFYGGHFTYESSHLRIWMSWERYESLIISFARPTKKTWYFFCYVHLYLDADESGKTEPVDFPGQPEALAELLERFLPRIEEIFSDSVFPTKRRDLEDLIVRSESRRYGFGRDDSLAKYFASDE